MAVAADEFARSPERAPTRESDWIAFAATTAVLTLLPSPGVAKLNCSVLSVSPTSDSAALALSASMRAHAVTGPTSEYEPSGHGRHSVSPGAFPNVLEPQGSHVAFEVAPRAALAYPAAHGVGMRDPSLHHAPAGHSKQRSAESFLRSHASGGCASRTSRVVGGP